MSFADDIRKATERYKGGYREVVATSLFKVSRDIIKMTPVGDPELWKGSKPKGYVGGRARSNWFASVGGYDSTITTDDTTPNYTEVGNITDGASGKVFYLTNNLPYIKSLEFEGHSSQAPSGMVRVSIENFSGILQNTINNL